MGIALARNIARPLTLLTAGAEAARRSPDVKLPDVKGYTEVVSLAASLNELLADRRQREQALTEAKAEAERATQQARTAHKRLLDAVDMIPMGFVIFDAEDRYVLWNQRFSDIYPTRTEIKTPGITFEESLRIGLARGEIPEAAGREEEWIEDRLVRHALPCSSQERQLTDGRWILVEERRTSDGGSIGIRLDITDIKRREASFRLLFDSNPLPMYVYDVKTLEFLAVNDSAVQHYGYSRERFLGMTILDIRPPEDRERVKKDALTATSDLTGRSTRHCKADGTVIDILLYKSMLTYEGRSASLVAITDVTERRRNEARITHMAHHDGLTDLANRTLFRDRLEKALARAKGGPGVALLCIDLDHFKDVNDTLGHPIGDILLRTVARRLRHCVRERDTVARIGGDEFAVIQDAIAGPEDAELLARRLIDSLSAPFEVDGHEVQVTASVGIATALDDQQSADHLLNHADIALYRAKGKGRRSHCFFEPDMDTELKARRTLELHLRQAFERREFEVHYQPWMNLLTGKVSGCEALLRWTHPERGSVSPAEFIPLAEDIGLIVPLGEWVLRQACMDAVAWPQACSVAVNLSPLQFRSGDLVEAVKSALAEFGLAPERLELEITETVLLEDNEVTLATLHALRSLGVRIAMDDFGTGYSSLSYLRSFPFDKIKIDRSFVQELPTSSECLTITRGIVGLAAGLGMTTIAEGVETADQLEVLRAIGCTQAQGFLFGAALPAPRVLRMLAPGGAGVEDAA
jgi:diguanylate cyclase (GGDEF)-like protein/PAS domain S-box-containing protein